MDTPKVVVQGGFMLVDGIKVARVVYLGDMPTLQFCDKDRRRSAERGTRFVEATPDEIKRAIESPKKGD